MLYSVTSWSVCEPLQGSWALFFCRLCMRTCTHAYMRLLLAGNLHDQASLPALLIVSQEPTDCESGQVILAELGGTRLVQLGDELVELLKFLRPEAEGV